MDIITRFILAVAIIIFVGSACLYFLLNRYGMSLGPDLIALIGVLEVLGIGMNVAYWFRKYQPRKD